MHTQTKVLGTLVLALAAFSLYLAIADFAAWYGTATLPLEGRVSNDFVFPLIIFSLLGSIIVNKRRRLEEQKPTPKIDRIVLGEVNV